MRKAGEGRPDTATIALNPAHWKPENAKQNEIYLIHELGHIYNFVSELGGSLIVYDATK